REVRENGAAVRAAWRNLRPAVRRSHNPALAAAPEQYRGVRIDPQAIHRNLRLDLAHPGGRRLCEGGELLRLCDLVGRVPPRSAVFMDRHTTHERGRTTP